MDKSKSQPVRDIAPRIVILKMLFQSAGWAGINIDDFPTLKAWEERMEARPGVAKGKDVPEPNKIKELLKDKKRMREIEEKSTKWIQEGMKEDAKRQK